MSPQSFCLEMFSSSGSGMDHLLSLHDQSVFNKLFNEYSGVGLSDLLYFIGVHPDSLLSALEDLGCKSLLALKANH